ncbi:DUF4145 domain-containing protein [Lysinibacillus sphaericus]|nr:DUF4145 domain-containing protein [Lysinibacillus sphaericus]
MKLFYKQLKKMSYGKLQDKFEEIKSMPLQKYIQTYINEADIKEMAEIAVWLGNDETHYVRKWENKDLQDFKHLIDLTVFFISMKLKALRYKGEMVTDRK